MTYSAIADRLASDKLVILDGGTGTELERRGVPMNADAWCGASSLEHVDTLVEVHQDFLQAGADVITANTYASSRLMLRPAGLSDRFADLNKSAIDAAQRARTGSSERDNIAVAGSLSHMIPLAKGTMKTAPDAEPSKAEVEDALNEMAELHKAEGCDLIVLEMMYHPGRTRIALDAASAVGLPVWAGLSARREKDGDLLSFRQDDDLPFPELASILESYDLAAAGTMHTPSHLIADTTDAVRAHHDGPLMAYPDSGFFRMPNWQFENIIPPAELQDYARGWRSQGVLIMGGCCGLGPEHIAALAELRD